tara:strand:- start:2325 stop:3275 length:951 start_codon:yes stop_codon:yes gene_type:complete
MTALDAIDRELLAHVADGIPLVAEPYAEIASQMGIDAADVIKRLERLRRDGVIKRFGLVVHHHELGYKANAMVVWDVPDEKIDALGKKLAAYGFVTLCYHRPRRLPQWPFNLFCMVHGKDRDTVRQQIAALNDETEIGSYPNAVLFSRRRFKQCGARYGAGSPSADVIPLDPIDRRIVNGLQGGFPVSKRPFFEAAEKLDIAEGDLISRLEVLCESGVLSRFGPMFNAEKLGGDVTLAAMAVPKNSFDRVADVVNAHPEVAHNYARDHRLNMWFVLSVERPEQIDEVIAEIETETGLPVFSMPKQEEYYVGLKVEI